jgi:hypothetical protein
MSIREVGRSGESKNPRGRRKKRKKPLPERLGAGLKHSFGAIDLGAMLGANDLGAMIYGTEVAVMSSPCLRRRLRQPKTLASNLLASKCVSSMPITTTPR